MHIVQLNHITINYAGRVIFHDLSWAIGDRDRVGLVGPNGSGKSSLLKAITGAAQPDQGTVVRAREVRIGYLPQDVTLTPGRTLLQEALTLPPALVEATAELDQIEAQLADPRVYNDPDRLAIEMPDLLLLDEPTNNLDIPSMEVLEEALDDFQGAMLVISHDRYFLDQVVDRVIELDEGTLRRFEGGYTDYLAASGRAR